MNNPKARRDGLFSERLAEETIVYDKVNHTAHTLNSTVAMVWQSADGDQSVNELTRILHSRLGIPADRGVVVLALEQLQAAGLLEVCIGAQPSIGVQVVFRRGKGDRSTHRVARLRAGLLSPEYRLP